MSVTNEAFLVVNDELIKAVSAKLDLRRPNERALEVIAGMVSYTFGHEKKPPPYECVIDVATGVGKTYVLAAAIEYYAQMGVRNFAVIAPQVTIRNKTIDQFTPGHPKSLVDHMDITPELITSENFASAQKRAVIDDPEEVKLFIFNVQSLLKPGAKANRKVHEYHEGLGQAFYEALQHADDLIVFADEHHAYFGEKFSDAVRDLQPVVEIGLTATPHPRTPESDIIYRYPLTWAIAEELVKTPVIVGRKDDRSDPETKLRDAARLLEYKEEAAAAYAQQTGVELIKPLALIVAPTINEAEEFAEIIRSPGFENGRYTDKVLVVHSTAPDEDLKALEALDDPGNEIQFCVSVGMLKEGWDCKRVYVISSMRASVSEVLTEQTLGRGMRLPYGRYTDLELLDTLEVIGHENYEKLLEKKDILNQAFVDRRKEVSFTMDAAGQAAQPEVIDEDVAVEITPDDGSSPPPQPSSNAPTPDGAVSGNGDGGPPSRSKTRVSSLDDQIRKGQEQVSSMQKELRPREDLPDVQIPMLKVTNVRQETDIADIADTEPFKALGRKFATMPESDLRRTLISAELQAGSDGLMSTRLVTSDAEVKVASPGRLIPEEEARSELQKLIILSDTVKQRPDQMRALSRFIDAFIEGLGENATETLNAHLSRAAASIIRLIEDELRRFAPQLTYDRTVEYRHAPIRFARQTATKDRTGGFDRKTGYEGYRKSLYTQDWFDSSPERAFANLIDATDEVEMWVRLQTGDMPIRMISSNYNPDFLVYEGDERFIVEIKADSRKDDTDVQEKRAEAKRWASQLTSKLDTGETWHYLLITETNLKDAKGSWKVLKQHGS